MALRPIETKLVDDLFVQGLSGCWSSSLLKFQGTEIGWIGSKEHDRLALARTVTCWGVPEDDSQIVVFGSDGAGPMR